MEITKIAKKEKELLDQLKAKADAEFYALFKNEKKEEPAKKGLTGSEKIYTQHDEDFGKDPGRVYGWPDTPEDMQDEMKKHRNLKEYEKIIDRGKAEEAKEPEVAETVKEPGELIAEPEPIIEKNELPAIPEKRENEEIEKSKIGKNQAQKEYAEIDYKETRLWKNMFSYFGDKLRRGGRKENSDVLYMRAAYENKLFDYKNAWVNDLKSKGLKGENLQKEIAKLEKHFDFDEKENLYNARTEAKKEYLSQNKSFAHSITLTMQKYNDWYNRQSKLLKIGVGVGLWASGLVALQAGRRLALAPITGMATAQTLDLVEKIGDEWMAKRKAGKTGENFKDDDLAWDNFSKSLEKSVFQVNDKFQNRKWRKVFNAAAGTAMGLVVGASAIEKVRDLLGWTPKGHLEIVPEKPEGISGIIPKHDLEKEGLDHTTEKITGATLEIAGQGHGSSLEGRLIDHLRDSGMDSDEAGRKAHLMAQEYAHAHGLKEGSLIHEGAKVTLDPMGEHITNIDDSHFGDLPEKNINHVNYPVHTENPVAPNETHGAAGGNIETPQPKNIPIPEDQFKNAPVDNPYRNHIVEQINKNTEAINLSHDEPLSHSESPFTKWDYEKYLDSNQKDLMGQLFAANKLDGKIRNLMEYISDKHYENWKSVKDLTVAQMLDPQNNAVNPEVKKRFGELFQGTVRAFKERGIKVSGNISEEKVSGWIAKIVKVSSQNK